MSIKRFSPEYHRNLCAAFMGEDGSGDYVLFSDHEAEIAQLRAALDDLREERDESKAEARKWESAFDAVHDALQSEVEAKSTSYGRTEKLHETAARVLKERDELAAEIDAVWIETGVASTARGLTTLVDVIGTDKMNLRNALANLRKCDDRIIAMRDALDEIGELSRALRSGGPDASDLQELSDALSSAVEIAHNALTKEGGNV